MSDKLFDMHTMYELMNSCCNHHTFSFVESLDASMLNAEKISSGLNCSREILQDL